MAEKKVSSKNRTRVSLTEKKEREEKNAVYNDFVDKYGAELRKRSTKVIKEPVRKTNTESANGTSSRCEEIDPHTTTNPAVQHQIITKRTGRILSDDTGFKAHSYNDRFELTQEMPEIRQGDNETEIETTQSEIPGQQTMADLFTDENISVPVESQISQEEQDPFKSAYEQLKIDGTDFGKSEKLRAIARTAADDASMEPESQIAFPAFDPLFRFPEKTEKKKERKIKHKDKKIKEPEEKFDIDESNIVTHDSEPAVQDEKAESAENAKRLAAERRQKFFDFLKDNGNTGETAPLFEISGRNEIKETNKKLALAGRTALIKSGLLLLSGIILFIISAVFDSAEDSAIRAVPIIYSFISFIFLLISGVICIKEITEGFRDFAKKKLTLNTGAIFILSSALIQNIASFIFHKSFPGNVHLLSAAAIISLVTVMLPKFFLSNNSRLAVGMFSGANGVSVLRKARKSGIDGTLISKYGNENSVVRYMQKTEFVSGLMEKLTNAVPKPFASNASYVFLSVFALIVAIASGFIGKSFMTGITTFSAIIITCLPVTYVLSASVILYNTNNSLASVKASLLTYRCAGELTKTDSFIFDASDLVEQSACSIHGIKPFGNHDPIKTTLYAASAINAACSPLAGIINQVTKQSDEEVPEAEDVNVTVFRGIEAIVEGHKIRIGSKEYMKECAIQLPDDDFEEKFITGDRKLIYIAVDGQFSMLMTVSYHIKRSVSAFLKFLSEKGIRIVLHSSDPNITPAFIAKKCRISEKMIHSAETSEAAYLLATENRTESLIPADVFSDGNINTVSALVRNAFRLRSYIDLLPLVVYAFSVISALIVAAPVLLGGIMSISNIYIIIIRIVGIAVFTAIGTIKNKKN
ncbi:MAG: hypothetical protein IKW03_04445 [Clostridia bacterium]|nr:hypothetical protein [Clostridia bacterium]